eukprot:5800686-Prymnesium_polylepis.1
MLTERTPGLHSRAHAAPLWLTHARGRLCMLIAVSARSLAYPRWRIHSPCLFIPRLRGPRRSPNVGDRLRISRREHLRHGCAVSWSRLVRLRVLLSPRVLEFLRAHL